MDVDDLVRGHYSGDDLEGRVLDALRRAGADVDRLRMEDLAALDQLHAGFGPATEHLLDVLGVGADTNLLDVGCGIGGPARTAAARSGCRVRGVDLSPDFVALARALSERLGLSHLVSFDVGSATDLPYDDATFDRAMMNHVGMNIADKAGVYREVRRVLVPGGRFAVYEQMRVGDGPLTYPMPWADDEQSSFIETRTGYVALLEDAGFAVEHDEDRTPANAAAGPPAPGTLSPMDLFGPAFAVRTGNNVAAAMTGDLAAVLIVGRAT